MRGTVNNTLKAKKGEREKSSLLKLSAVVRDAPTPTYILLVLALMKYRGWRPKRKEVRMM